MKFLPVLVLALALAAVGCLEREEEYTINPDGSGKLKLSWIAAPNEFFMGLADADPDEMVKGVVGAELRRLQGIDCWKDVTYSLRDDGKIAFSGTAYFKDITAVSTQGHERNPLTFTLTFEKNDKGIVLGVKEFSGSDEKAGTLSDDEVKKRMKRLRMKYQMMRPALKACLADYKSKCTIRLPGALDEAKGFVSAGGVLRMDVDGPSLLKSCEDLYLADAALRKAVEEGADLEVDFDSRLPGKVGEMVFRSKEVKATTKGELKPAFDYDKEVTEDVRAAYKKLLESLPKEEAIAMGGPGGVVVPAEEGSGKSLETTLREALVVDFAGETPLASTQSVESLRDGANVYDEDFGYDISGPTFSSSGGGDEGRHITLKFGERNHLEHLAWRTGRSSVTFRQGGKGVCRITVDDEATGLVAVLLKTAAGVHYLRIRDNDTFSRKWASFEEAARSEPGEIGLFLAQLRTVPLKLKPTAADSAVAELALKWSDRVDAASKEKLDAIRKRLLDESLEERTKAGADLAKEIGTDTARLRYVMDWLAALKDHADAIAVVQGAIQAHAETAEALAVVRDGELHRNLPYLGALLADSARTEAAKARLKALTGRDFATRADLDAWHAANKDKLKWDEAKGTYSAAK